MSIQVKYCRKGRNIPDLYTTIDLSANSMIHGHFLHAVPINFSSIATASAKSKSVNAPHWYHRRQQSAWGRRDRRKSYAAACLRYRRPLAFPFCISNSREQSDRLNSTCVHARVYDHRNWQTGKRTASIPTTFGLTRLQPAMDHVLVEWNVPEKENTEIVSNSHSSRTG